MTFSFCFCLFFVFYILVPFFRYILNTYLNSNLSFRIHLFTVFFFQTMYSFTVMAANHSFYFYCFVRPALTPLFIHLCTLICIFFPFFHFYFCFLLRFSLVCFFLIFFMCSSLNIFAFVCFFLFFIVVFVVINKLLLLYFYGSHYCVDIFAMH